MIPTTPYDRTPESITDQTVMEIQQEAYRVGVADTEANRNQDIYDEGAADGSADAEEALANERANGAALAADGNKMLEVYLQHHNYGVMKMFAKTLTTYNASQGPEGSHAAK